MDTIEEEPSSEKTTAPRLSLAGDRIGAFSVHGPGRHRRDDDRSVSTAACSEDDEASTMYDVENAYCIRATVVTDAAEPTSSRSNTANNSTMEVYEGRIVSQQTRQDLSADLEKPVPLLSRKVRILMGVALIVVVTAIIAAGVTFVVHRYSSSNALETLPPPPDPQDNGEKPFYDGGNDKPDEDPSNDAGKNGGRNDVLPSTTGGGNGSGNNGGQHRSNIRLLQQRN